MIVAEQPIVFACGAHRMLGVLHGPPRPASVGVLIVVGGPQYRVGSHRQFLLMARSLAASGIPVLRFDCRGMGDSEGRFAGFEYIGDDIRAAVDAFFAHQSGLARVVLWGLCDAASANLFYGATDERVAGMVLVNPWIRTETGHARAHLRHYYLQRLREPAFWRRVTRGEFKAGTSLAALAGMLRDAVRPAKPQGPGRAAAPEDVVSLAALGLGDATLPARILAGLAAFERLILFVLSGNDLTAREFEDVWRGSRAWRRAMKRSNVTIRSMPPADHTWSTRADLEEATRLTREWVERL